MTYRLQIHGSEKVLLESDFYDITSKCAYYIATWWSSGGIDENKPIVDVYEDGELIESWGLALDEPKYAVKRLDKPTETC